ncbi:MAG: C2 domain-containing protein [Benniella sp.]|nr:MAG: C2 domain-containing protein [Benniella sp.]
MSKSLVVIARHANALEDVENFGKNDPYCLFTLDLEDKQSFEITSTKDNAGNNVEWNEVVVLENFDASRHHNLFVEVFDKEKGVDQIIGYTTIPLHQVNDAPNQSFKGKFDLLNTDGKQKGTISLTIAVVDAARSGDDHTNSGPEVNGQSTNDSKHQDRISSITRTEKAGDAAAVIAGLGLLGIGIKAAKGRKAPKPAA